MEELPGQLCLPRRGGRLALAGGGARPDPAGEHKRLVGVSPPGPPAPCPGSSGTEGKKGRSEAAAGQSCHPSPAAAVRPPRRAVCTSLTHSRDGGLALTGPCPPLPPTRCPSPPQGPARPRPEAPPAPPELPLPPAWRTRAPAGRDTRWGATKGPLSHPPALGSPTQPPRFHPRHGGDRGLAVQGRTSAYANKEHFQG